MALNGLWDDFVQWWNGGGGTTPAKAPDPAAMWCFTDAVAEQSVCSDASGQTTKVEDATLMLQPTQQSIPGKTAPSEDVRQAQRQLVAKGYDVGKSGIDGLFGPDTGKAVLRFQADHGLTQTGALDTATMAVLFDVPKSQAKAVPEARPDSTSHTPQDQTLKIVLVVAGLAAVGVGFIVWQRSRRRALPAPAFNGFYGLGRRY